MSAVPIETAVDAEERPQLQTVRVWDLPLRIFHWSLAIAIAAAYVTAEFGGSEWGEWHGRIGWFVLALFIFRLVWGFIGAQHARFRSFFPTPGRIRAYLQGRWRGVGHNPLGALSVLALLILVGAQVATGLFANDDISFAGPLASWIDSGASQRLTSWHEQVFYVLAGFILLHIVAVLFYLLWRRSNLIAPMLTGYKLVAYAPAVASEKSLAWRFAAAVFVAVAVSWLIFRDAPPVQAESVAAPGATSDW